MSFSQSIETVLINWDISLWVLGPVVAFPLVLVALRRYFGKEFIPIGLQHATIGLFLSTFFLYLRILSPVTAENVDTFEPNLVPIFVPVYQYASLLLFIFLSLSYLVVNKKFFGNQGSKNNLFD